MTMGMAHLKSEEIVDALDGVLSAARREHLDACERCREELRQFQEMTGAVHGAGGVVPEPSPLFWSHMSDRVRAAASQIQPARAPWKFEWRWAGAVAASVVALFLIAVLRHHPAPPAAVNLTGVEPPAATSEAGMVSTSDASFTFVAEMAATLPYEELHQAAAPTSDAADAMVGQLTDAERAEFVRLLKAASGSAE